MANWVLSGTCDLQTKNAVKELVGIENNDKDADNGNNQTVGITHYNGHWS